MMSRSLKNFTFVGSWDRGGVEVMIWWFTGGVGEARVEVEAD